MILAANIAMAVLWAVLVGPFSPANLLVGFVVGFIALRLMTAASKTSTYAFQSVAVIDLIIFTLWELIKANFKVAWHTVASLSHLRPAILAIPIKDDTTDTEIMLLSNLITLTPGTLTLDVSEDRSKLYVHYMHVGDADSEILAVKRGFERRVRAATRGERAPTRASLSATTPRAAA